MKSGAGRGRRQNQWRGKMKYKRGKKAARTVGGNGREERTPSRQWGVRCWCDNMALECEEKNRNGGTERPE